jgi:single-strand DNA-binding protein
MNTVNLIGRLTKDPEVNEYGKGKNKTIVATFTLAVDGYGDKTNFIRCKAFNTKADFCENYLFKGVKIGITGEIQTDSYENKNGDTVYTTDIICNNFTFCEKKDR